MRCIICYSSPFLICNLKIQARKDLILYNITNQITTLKKHVNANHFIIANFFEKEVKNPLREVEKQFAKKRSNPSTIQLSFFLLLKIFSRRSYAVEIVF
jgi:hypothetical protein